MVIAYSSEKNSIEYIIWYNIKLRLHEHSLDSIAPGINCQEVIYLFRRKMLLLLDQEINMASSPDSLF